MKMIAAIAKGAITGALAVLALIYISKSLGG